MIYDNLPYKNFDKKKHLMFNCFSLQSCNFKKFILQNRCTRYVEAVRGASHKRLQFMKLLLQNIKELVQVEENPVSCRSGENMAEVKTIKNAFLIIRDELIQDFGPMVQLKDVYKDDDFLVEIDCSDRMVYPSYCDSHTQILFPSWNDNKFAGYLSESMNGFPNHSKNSIMNDSGLLRELTDEQLFEGTLERINEIMRTGTGAVEIKSGYGLNTEDEIRMLQIIKKIRKTTPVCVRSTFLGAHAVPEEYIGRVSAYVDLIIHEVIPRIASEELSDFIDVSCDKGFFSVEETERILEEGAKYGLRPKLHASDFGLHGGVQAGVKHRALSVDHLEHIGKAEIDSLKNTETMPVVLPGISFFLGAKNAPVREMIQAGLPVALASGYNPDSSPSGNMNFIASLGCINYKMSPREVINATTLNSAFAMGISDRLGSIARGKTANVFITSEIPSIEYLPYSYGSNLVETIILNGEIQML
jgi:imidazolonepropionase